MLLLRDPQFNNFFQFRFVCGIFFLNHSFPPSKGVWCRAKALRDVKISFFWLRVHLITFIISIETEASLLALAKSIYYLTCKLTTEQPLLYEHRWNTKWAFARKRDIFTCENNMLSSHVKISPLHVWLHYKPHLSDQKTI